MRLSDPAGSALELRVTGYQFAGAAEPAKRYSWHMVEGEATCGGERWPLRYPALTCDETPRVSAWLRRAADWIDAAASGGGAPASVPAPLSFTEPNLAFQLTRTPEPSALVLEISLGQEFRRPRHRGTFEATDTLRITANASEMRRAAAEWDAEWAPYPEGSRTSSDDPVGRRQCRDE